LPCAIGQPLRLAARLLGCGNGCLLRLARQPPRLLEALARLRKEIVGSLLRGLGLTLGGLGLFDDLGLRLLKVLLRLFVRCRALPFDLLRGRSLRLGDPLLGRPLRLDDPLLGASVGIVLDARQPGAVALCQLPNVLRALLRPLRGLEGFVLGLLRPLRGLACALDSRLDGVAQR
jgi:hypothetical protein